uniref:Uncharacterized protein n=1 Tax=Micrurus lemniscatus lemniscatus TaxID=129467 RepID=A0A2D4J0E8_MICLE
MPRLGTPGAECGRFVFSQAQKTNLHPQHTYFSGGNLPVFSVLLSDLYLFRFAKPGPDSKSNRGMSLEQTNTHVTAIVGGGGSLFSPLGLRISDYKTRNCTLLQALFPSLRAKRSYYFA